MQIEKAVIDNRVRGSKISFAAFLKSSLLSKSFYCLLCL